MLPHITKNFTIVSGEKKKGLQNYQINRTSVRKVDDEPRNG